jgi:hypothetical protein
MLTIWRYFIALVVKSWRLKIFNKLIIDDAHLCKYIVNFQDSDVASRINWTPFNTWSSRRVTVRGMGWNGLAIGATASR